MRGEDKIRTGVNSLPKKTIANTLKFYLTGGKGCCHRYANLEDTALRL